MKTPARYIIRDLREREGGLRRIREPWQVIDTETNRVEEEYHSKRAAQMHARQLNDEAGAKASAAQNPDAR